MLYDEFVPVFFFCFVVVAVVVVAAVVVVVVVVAVVVAVVVVVVNCFWLVGLYALMWVLFSFCFVSLLPSWWWAFVVVLGWVILLLS